MPDTVSLAGPWRLAFANSAGSSTEPPSSDFIESITLPATTETAGLGPLNPERRTQGLTAVRRFVGAAWYQREFSVPSSWADHTITLILERTKHTSVWLDGRPLGSLSTLCTPQSYALGRLTPGAHRLTIRVDNARLLVPGDNHQVSEHTQGNWNGILGRLELRPARQAWVERVGVTPDFERKLLQLDVRLGHEGSAPLSGALTAVAQSFNHDGPTHRPQPVTIRLSGDADGIRLEYPLGPDARTWDEFSPALYRVTVALDSLSGGHSLSLTTGLREFRARGGQFSANGRTAFLRGEVNCCVFPLTGHPPMDIDGWHAYFRVLREHGLNHVRFHSWTPPEAAFAAADELGIYVQTELPFWGEWSDAIRRTLQPEAEAILSSYGHHPSFVILTLGNEHRGERAPMSGLIAHLRNLDASRLYAEGANNYLETPTLSPADDLWITARLPDPSNPGHLANLRGAYSTNDVANGHLQTHPVGTRVDYASSIAGLALPVVSHEIGQHSVHPHFAEAARYTGVFAARNLEQFRSSAEQAGTLARADAFFAASARLAALLYREEVEAALRTPGFGGFQLLGLQDFPGQGTALVGLLDAFLSPKGSMDAVEFRRFCSPISLVARFDRHMWVCGERFEAELQLAHYGRADVPAGQIAWSLKEPTSAATLAEGRMATEAAAQGGLRPLATLTFSFPTRPAATRLELSLSHAPSGAGTSYPLWLYPPCSDERLEPGPGLVVTRKLDETTAVALAHGARVVLIADGARPPACSPGGSFAPDFWCWELFKNKPGTQGLLVDAAHPALGGFPTDSHADWQWARLACAARPVVLDALPAALEPIVQVIDNPVRAHRLGLLFEAHVGTGSLLVCAVDLAALAIDHPEARQLLASLLAYANSDHFRPTVTCDLAPLASALAPADPTDSRQSASQSHS